MLTEGGSTVTNLQWVCPSERPVYKQVRRGLPCQTSPYLKTPEKIIHWNKELQEEDSLILECNMPQKIGNCIFIYLHIIYLPYLSVFTAIFIYVLL